MEPNVDPNAVFCPVLMLPKPVPAVWLVLLVPKSGVGAAAIDKIHILNFPYFIKKYNFIYLIDNIMVRRRFNIIILKK